MFDVGTRAICDTDFVEIYDVNPLTSEETFIAKYCGDVSSIYPSIDVKGKPGKVKW